MALKPGTRLGPYEILAQIGAGGMGEVYKGRDTRLERLVAIKTLPAHLADRPELRERFKREAHAIANLKHAHICVLYDIGSQELEAEEVAPPSRRPLEPAGSRRYIDYLVMEYLEGETLSERLKKGPLALDQVLRYAEELADALDTAHRAEFTHRDIKPGNIMLTKEGSKLLDFGLAKMKQEIAQAITPASERPTVPGTLTEQGTLLGTLQYMAPEQVEGKVNEIDARTDIFAFGAVVYEMATRKKAFDGQTQASVIAKILEVEPPPISTHEPPGNLSPPALDRVVKRCLAKDRDQRWQTAYDLWQDVKWIKEGGGQAASATITESKPPAKGLRRAIPLGVSASIAIVLAIVSVIAFWQLRPPTPPSEQQITRFALPLAPGESLILEEFSPAVALSPDGKRLAYAAIRGGTQQLYLRNLDSLEIRPIAGTEGANYPFFSPDGDWIGFLVQNRLMKVGIQGGAPQALGLAQGNRGVAWGPNDTIVVGVGVGGLRQVSAAEGTRQPLTTLDTTRGENSHRWPEFLPGGKAILFAAGGYGGTWDAAQIVAQRLDTGEQKVLVEGGTFPRYVPGYLLYVRASVLMAAPFDAERLEITGASYSVVDGVRGSPQEGVAQFSVSGTGSLVYFGGGPQGTDRTLAWVDRAGKGQSLPAPSRPYEFPRLSPDRQQIALRAGSDIWVYHIPRETLTRLTFEGVNNYPIWTPDGKRVTFQRAGRGQNVFWKNADGTGTEEQLTQSEYSSIPHSWSPDGQVLAFQQSHPTNNFDLWLLPLQGDPSTSSGQAPSASSPRPNSGQAGQGRKPQLFLQTPFYEGGSKFSPDGRYLAYTSQESGLYQVYVQPVSGSGGKWQISTEGGREVAWAPSGREIFYRNGNKMMVVDVRTEPTFTAGRPRLLFEGDYRVTPTPSIANYDVAPDGQRFLMIQPVETQASAPTQIHVVLNWFEELKRRVPVR